MGSLIYARPARYRKALGRSLIAPSQYLIRTKELDTQGQKSWTPRIYQGMFFQVADVSSDHLVDPLPGSCME